MVIAHVIDSLEVGGAETVVAGLCRSHAAAGHRVEVHCLMAAGRLAIELEQEGVRVSVHVSNSAWASVWKLFRAFRSSRPDVVHGHNKVATIRAAVAARLTGTRAVVSTRHGIVPLPFRMRDRAEVLDHRGGSVRSRGCGLRVCPAQHDDRGAARRAQGRHDSQRCIPATTVRGSRCRQGWIHAGQCGAARRRQGFRRHYCARSQSPRRSVPNLALWIVGDGD